MCLVLQEAMSAASSRNASRNASDNAKLLTTLARRLAVNTLH